MPTMTIVMSDPVPPGSPLLLVPRLVNAFGFRQTSLQVDDGEIVGELTAGNSLQGGYLIRPTAAPRRPILRYSIAETSEDPPEWIWDAPDTRYARPSDELAAFVRHLVDGSENEAEALRRIVRHAGEVFWYGHGPGAVMDGRNSVPLLTQPTRGHCLDMHGYCVAACRAAGLTAAYCAGFWFKEGMNRAPGMHCWFVARVDGEIVHYDVSHQLKLPTRPILPGLNPIPGIRFLAAVGKGLSFATPLGVVTVDHFAKLVWRTEDGRDHYPAHELQLDMAGSMPVEAASVQFEPAC
jgi:hypothetical protein